MICLLVIFNFELAVPYTLTELAAIRFHAGIHQNAIFTVISFVCVREVMF